jgi:hypothetical protein
VAPSPGLMGSLECALVEFGSIELVGSAGLVGSARLVGFARLMGSTKPLSQLI